MHDPSTSTAGAGTSSEGSTIRAPPKPRWTRPENSKHGYSQWSMRSAKHVGYSHEEQAALVIQRNYRAYAARKKVERMKMEPNARWDDLLRRQDEKAYASGQLENKNDVKSRWQRGVHAAVRLQKGEGIYNSPSPSASSSSKSPSASLNTAPADQNQGASADGTAELSKVSSSLALQDVDSTSLGVGKIQLDDKDKEHIKLDKETRKKRRARFWGKLTLPTPSELRDEEDLSKELPFRSKALEQQHWLEMVDHKHRYGSNIKFYFRKWKEAQTNDNFFRWMDIGDGKDLDLEELPRERLEREVITYLSAEQRLNYLVKIDKDGLLRWARNNELVDTAAGKWRDSGDGTGIIPDETYTGLSPITDEQAYASRTHRLRMHRTTSTGSLVSNSDASSVSSDSWSAGSELQDNEATHYSGLKERHGFWDRRVKGVTPAGVRDELLRKTVKRNTWIYACDMRLNMFVGIKTSGAFQHSSFLAGGKVTSAGIIVVKHGVIKSLGPWSGHYRSTIDHYRAFIAQLENKGADLSHVKVGKSVLQMWGLGKYMKLTKQPEHVAWKVKKMLGMEHDPDEKEASKEVMKNGEKELREISESKEREQITEKESGHAEDDARDKEGVRAAANEKGEPGIPSANTSQEKEKEKGDSLSGEAEKLAKGTGDVRAPQIEVPGVESVRAS